MTSCATISALGEAALRYASRGWHVFPCRPGGKEPVTRRGLHDATRESRVIESWWNATPDANVAVRTGRASQIVVLDVDGDDGMDTLRGLESQHGPLPRTASVVTPRGGAHYYFAHPGHEIPNSAGRLGPALDVRGDGGYVVAPPSTGPNGRRYEPDERARLAPMPPWLTGLLAPPDERRKPEPAGTWVRIVRDGLTEGERNQGIARLVGHLLARGIDALLVTELALLVNARSRPPLPAVEVDRIVDSIAGRELRRRIGERP
jgi:Bifunctional DNA primase/polymerase, N-terminal/Primase C terminal 1 (PriCT-1)